MAVIRIKDLLSPAFHRLYEQIWLGEYTHYWLKGGRGSAKSSFISLQIILGLMTFRDAHAVCFRKYGCDLRLSVYNQILWAIDTLGYTKYFSATVSPMEITYLPTGQKIQFKGLDDARKSKSQKPRFSYYKYVWFEELEQYDGMQEIRNVMQSLMRGGKDFIYFYSFNPPERTSSWVNFEAGVPVANRLVHHSTFLDVPPDWLGEAFIIEANLLKARNEIAYRHEYLGEVVGTGGSIFTNLVSRPITDEEVNSFDRIKRGIDWGFAVDPFCYTAAQFDKARRTLYIFDEIYKVGLLNADALDIIRSKNIGRDLITADSAEPKSISEFVRAGINVRPAIKGKDSVRYGIKWLQGLEAIVIDPVRCPNAWKELSMYEFEKDKTGGFKSDYPDKDNHVGDALRYSLESEMEKRGLF